MLRWRGNAPARGAVSRFAAPRTGCEGAAKFHHGRTAAFRRHGVYDTLACIFYFVFQEISHGDSADLQ